VSQISLITGIVTIILDLTLIPLWNATGAALISTITYALGLFLAVKIYKRIVKVKLTNLLIPTFDDICFFPRLLLSLITTGKDRSSKVKI
jgi:O-antigen/teichoic acid export membrane protein